MTTNKKKKMLNLQSEQHSKYILKIVEKSLAGITMNEITELRKLCTENRIDYYNHIKLRYITLLGLLGINFQITEEVESTVFFFIHDILHQITVDTSNGNEVLDIKIS